MGELVRMPHAQIMSPTEDVDPLHPQAQVLMMISGDVYMTMTPPPAPTDPEPTANAELGVEVVSEPEAFRRKDRRPDQRPGSGFSLKALLSRGKHRGPRA